MLKIDATLSKRKNYIKARWNCPRPRSGVRKSNKSDGFGAGSCAIICKDFLT